MLATRSLPCVLALVMEGWADWLLVVPQFRAKVIVFCDGLPEVSELFEDSGLDAGEWMSVSQFWEHGVLTDPRLCVLVSGSHLFVNAALSRIPREVRVVAAVSQGKRKQKCEGEDRLRWRTVRHQDVGGVTTIRCDLGFPREWREFQIRPHVQRRVKHIIVHSERATPLRGERDAASLQSTGELLDHRRLDTRFALPLRTRKGEVPGQRALTALEIGTALDLPLAMAKEMQSRGFQNELGRLVVGGCPGKCLYEAMQHVYTCVTGCEEVFQLERPLAPRDSRPRMRISSGPKPAAEASLPPWARVCMDNAKAAKADEAKPNIPMWDLRIQERRPDLSAEFLAQFREMLMVGWRRRCYLSFRRFLRGTYGDDWLGHLLQGRRREVEGNGRRGARKESSREEQELVRDSNQGVEVLVQVFGGPGTHPGGTYWDWDAGSALLFWRWPPELKVDARDGSRVYVQGRLPRYRAPQRIPREASQAQQLRDKLWRVRERGYIQPGPVVSLTNVFAVPKVQDEAGNTLDIRPVYDATKSGLNEAVWCPSFWMPSTETLARMLDFDSWLGDIDLGEMFLNFPLDARIRPYAGVDLTGFATAEERGGKAVMWERWGRTLMGFKPSPYIAIRLDLLGEEIVRGDRLNPSNVFRWDRVRLNLPGSDSFDPCLPWVSKVFMSKPLVGPERVRIACDYATFVDDIRGAGFSLEATWLALRRVASVSNYLGIQDAPRKRRSPLKTEAGAWIGSLQRIYDHAIVFLTSQQKWDKGRRIVKGLLDRVQQGSPLCLKTLLKEKGFLVHLAMTYPLLVPYLKGLHLTADSWREGRDSEGWKMTRVALEAYLASRGDEAAGLIPADPKAPKEVTPVPRLERDLLSLSALMDGEEPAERVIRAKTIVHIVYGFGDASGTGFGSTSVRLKSLGRLREIGEPVPVGDSTLRYRIGVWGKDVEGQSSNYRESRNIIETLEKEEELGGLEDSMVFFSTDNEVFEECTYKGTSSSPLLYDLVLRMKKIEMRTGCLFYVFHVAGRRMIAQGTDGVSRGNLAEGVMAGVPMAEFLPLHLSPVDRAPGLLAWVRSWLGNDCELLTPEGWYERGHDFDGGRRNSDGVWMPNIREGKFIWAPPPAAADAALEELRKARHKRQDSFHVLLIPRLMTAKWRKQLHKACDCVFVMPAGCGLAWPDEMFEPCLIGLCFPFLHHRPWQLRGAPRLLALERTVRRLWEDGDSAVAACLCQFLDKARKFRSMPEDVVRKMLYV